MMDAMLVSATPWKITDDKTGEVRTGCRVGVLINEFATTDRVIGYTYLSGSISMEDYEKVQFEFKSGKKLMKVKVSYNINAEGKFRITSLEKAA